MTQVNKDKAAAIRGRLTGLLPEQSEAVTSAAPLTVVSAGAGTGKTQTLSQRFVWLLAEQEDCPVDRILVLTFTEKAAREMRERIRGTLVRWYEEEPKALSHLGERIAKFEDAYISTIHSFAMKIIKESGLALNIDPSARIVTKPEEELWWRAFSDMIGTLSRERIKAAVSGEWAERADELFDEDSFKDFVNHYGPERLAQISRDASEKWGSFGRTPDDLWKQNMDNLLEDTKKAESVFDEIWDVWQDYVFPLIRDDLREKPGVRFEGLRDIEAGFCLAEPSFDDKREFASLLLWEGISDLRSCSRNIKGGIESALGMKLTEWRDEKQVEVLMASRPSKGEERLGRLLCRTSALGWHCWENRRKIEGILTNDDLIRYAGEVLKKDPDFGKKFSHILVDEFQDTDGLQDMLLRGLWNEGSNTLFIVGDIKQSIYRFRHANLKIFADYIKLAKGGEKRYRYITLDKSFRTHDGLVKSINYVFASVWSEGIGRDASMAYEPLSSPSTEAWWQERISNPMEPGFDLLVTKRERLYSEEKKEYGAPEKVRQSRVRLYAALAEKIDEMHRSESLVWEGEGFRKIKWSDFALLLPKRTFYSAVEEGFDLVGIPYVLRTRRDYFTRGETSDVVNLISLLAEPEDASYLAGWVASPLSCLQPGEAERLLAMTESTNEGSTTMAEVLRRERPEMDELLKRLKGTAELRGVSAAIREILVSSEPLLAYEPHTRGRVRANILYMADLADEYESSQGRSLPGCAEYMRFAVKGAKQQEEPEITDEDQDSVNVLTIHSAKGLEYPVVALGGTEEKLKGPPTIEASLRYGVVERHMPDFLRDTEDRKGRTVSGVWHMQSEAEALREENERFWYVAATRAKDKLIVCGLADIEKKSGDGLPPSEGSFLKMMADSGKPICLAGEASGKYDGAEPFCRHGGESGPYGAMMLFPKVVSPAKLARISASAYAMLSWCPAAYRLAYRQGREMKWTERIGDGTGGSEFGSLAHRILSMWDFDTAKIASLLPENENDGNYEASYRRIPYELRGEFRSRGTRMAIRKMLADYSETDEGRRLRALAEQGRAPLFRETPFRVRDGDLLLVGSVDLFWEDEDLIRLRDWKTATEETAPGLYYEKQLEFYAYSLFAYRKERALPEKDIETGIIYLRDPGALLPSVMRGEELARAKENIHRAAVEALSETFGASPDRCEICPWGGICTKRYAP